MEPEVKKPTAKDSELIANFKKMNRDILRNRLMNQSKNGEEEPDILTEEQIFNLNVALNACDNFEELFEFIQIL